MKENDFKLYTHKTSAKRTI